MTPTARPILVVLLAGLVAGCAAASHPAVAPATVAPEDTMTPTVRHILTILAVRDLPRAVRFYRDAFGWPTTVDVPVYVELALPGGQRLGLYDREGFARNTGQPAAEWSGAGTTGTEIYFHCDDLDAAIARCAAAGATALSPRAERPWGDEAAYFADPDGNVLVLARPLGRRSAP